MWQGVLICMTCDAQVKAIRPRDGGIYRRTWYLVGETPEETNNRARVNWALKPMRLASMKVGQRKLWTCAPCAHQQG